MNSIRKLIDQGVAPMRTTYWGKDKPSTCLNEKVSLIRNYNNIYATITNTHMDLGPMFQPIITGSLISNQKEWNKFCFSQTYLGVEFPMPLIEWVESQSFEMHLRVLNGQIIAELIHIDKTANDQNEK